jgi:hypothetical protein
VKGLPVTLKLIFDDRFFPLPNTGGMHLSIFLWGHGAYLIFPKLLGSEPVLGQLTGESSVDESTGLRNRLSVIVTSTHPGQGVTCSRLNSCSDGSVSAASPA